MSEACPCGSDQPYERCCAPIIEGQREAESAEALMRSRYTAYTRGDSHYLLKSWHPDTRPEQLDLTSEPQPRWLGLKIVRTEAGTINDQEGRVEFIARFKSSGRAERLHEVSRFIKLAGQWLYRDGVLNQHN